MKRSEKYPETNTFHYYNANPKNRITTDCWLRAVCTGLNEPYNEVLKEMVKVHLETGYEMSSNMAIDKYLASKGWIKHKQPRKPDGKKYTGEEFCKMLQQDAKAVGMSFIANTGGHHMVCIKETGGLHGSHKVHDIWNSTDGCIGNYWTKGYYGK